MYIFSIMADIKRILFSFLNFHYYFFFCADMFKILFICCLILFLIITYFLPFTHFISSLAYLFFPSCWFNICTNSGTHSERFVYFKSVGLFDLCMCSPVFCTLTTAWIYITSNLVLQLVDILPLVLSYEMKKYCRLLNWLLAFN